MCSTQGVQAACLGTDASQQQYPEYSIAGTNHGANRCTIRSRCVPRTQISHYQYLQVSWPSTIILDKSSGTVCIYCIVQVPIRIIQIDSTTYGSDAAEASVVDVKPEGLSQQEQQQLGEAKVNMLYRPGHYDIIYPKHA